MGTLLNKPVADIPTDALWEIDHHLRLCVKHEQLTDDEEVANWYADAASDFWNIQAELIKRGELAPEDAVSWL